MFKKRKLTAFLIIGVFILLLYGKNLLERRAFRSISSTFTEVYDDRLMVESYIFQISGKLYAIQKLIDHCDLSYDYSQVVVKISAEEQAILKLVRDFEGTVLTEKEAVLLTDFKRIIESDLNIKNYQLLYSDSSGVNREQVRLYDQKIDRAQQDLTQLNSIQLEEGEKLVSKAKTLVNRSQIWAQFELGLLLCLLLLIYFFLFQKPLHEEEN